MKIPFLAPKPVPRLDEIEADDVFEAFSHASEAFKNSSGLDREKIGLYLDRLLDIYLESEREQLQ